MVRGIASRESRAAISDYSRASLSRARARAFSMIGRLGENGSFMETRRRYRDVAINASGARAERERVTPSARKRCSLKSRFLTACGAHPCRRASIIVQIVKEADYANALDNGGFARACESECAVPIRASSHSIVSVLGQPEIPAFVASVFTKWAARDARDAMHKKKEKKEKKWRGASAFRRNWPRRDNAERRLTAPPPVDSIVMKILVYYRERARERERERERGRQGEAQPPSKPRPPPLFPDN